MKPLQAATRLLADWWSDLGPEGQEKYIKDHPNSEKAKEARKGGSGKAEQKGPEKKSKSEDKPSGDGGGKQPPKDTKPQTDEAEPEKKEPKKESKPEGKKPAAPSKKPAQPKAPAPQKKPAAQPDDGGQPPKQKPLAPGKPLAEYAAAKDDPNITVDQIYATLKPEDAEEMKQKGAEAMRLPPSDRQYMARDGNYTPERAKLHDAIVAKIVNADAIKRATPAPGEKPTFVVLGGRGGSGKSAFTSPDGIKEFDSNKFLVLDPDAIKEMLDPPYEGWNANQVHEESSYVFDKIFAEAKARGLNIVSDATLKSDKMGATLEGLINNDGYEVEGHYMFLPRQKAAQRACGRYLKKGPEDRGRLVPPEVILGNTNNEKNFDALKKYFKKWSCYDNDQPKGQPPKLIDHSDVSGKGGKEEAKVKVKAMEQKDKTKTEAGYGYDADSWENDAFLGMTPEREAVAQRELFGDLRKRGVRTGEIRNPQIKKGYVEYLKKIGG